jgi:hypothetical protein
MSTEFIGRNLAEPLFAVYCVDAQGTIVMIKRSRRDTVLVTPEDMRIPTLARQVLEVSCGIMERTGRPGEWTMPHRTQKPPSINGITIGYGDEPSAFAREIQIVFTRACNKAIADLRKRDFQSIGSDSPKPTPVGAWRNEED